MRGTPGSDGAAVRGWLKRCGALLLAAVLCCGLFPIPAGAEGPAPAGFDEVVDLVTLHYNNDAMAALLADGTVRTAGLEGTSLDAEQIAAVASWTDIVQLAATGSDLLGLRADGSVVSTVRAESPYRTLEDPYIPDHWTDVRELVTSEFEYYGVTDDGRVLVSNGEQDFSFGGGAPYLDWENVDTVRFYAYPESRGLVGLRRDGTLLHPSDYCFFSADLTDVTAVESSGYIHCALLADGSVRVAGAAVEYGLGGLTESAAAVRDAVQIAVNDRVVLCRLKSGEVAVCGPSESYGYSAARIWHDIRDVQLAGRVAFGLDRFGRVHTAVPDAGDDRYAALRAEVESWTDIARIKAYDGFGYDEPYVLGWHLDGSLVAAGLDLSGLDLRQTPPVRYTDALYDGFSGGVVALRDDGTVASAGLPEACAKPLDGWRDITQIRCANAVLYGLRADGGVEALSLVPEGSVFAPDRGEIEKVLEWRDIRSLVSTGQRIVGLTEDGGIAVGGPAWFGTEETADFSAWTELFSLEAGSCIGGEYLIGRAADGIVYKSASLVGDWTGTPRRVIETACSGFQLLCLEQDGTVVSLGFPGVGDWFLISHVCALDGLALGLRRDATVAVDVLDGYYSEEAVEQIRGWTDIRGLSVAGGLVVAVTNGGETLVAESEDIVRDYGRDCLDAIESWTDLDRVLCADPFGHVLALRRNGSLVSYGLPLP